MSQHRLIVKAATVLGLGLVAHLHAPRAEAATAFASCGKCVTYCPGYFEANTICQIECGSPTALSCGGPNMQLCPGENVYLLVCFEYDT